MPRKIHLHDEYEMPVYFFTRRARAGNEMAEHARFVARFEQSRSSFWR